MKINAINNVGCLANVNSEIDLGNYAFIYGLNGAGKSTLKELFCNISLVDGQITPKFGSNKSSCSAEIKIFNKKYEYKKSKIVKNGKLNIHVYDNKYVEDSIYVNGSVNDNNKAQYYKLFVGDKINNRISGFLNENVELISHIENINRTINLFENTLKSVDYILCLIKEISDFVNNKYDVNFIIDSVVKTKLNKDIKRIDDYTINWIKQGKKIQKKDNICPYCGQTISPDLYENYINKYEDIIVETIDVVENINTNIDNLIQKVNNFTCDNLYYRDSQIIVDIKNKLLDSLYYKKSHISEKCTLDVTDLKKELCKKVKYFKDFIVDFKSMILDLNIVSLFSLPIVQDDYSKQISLKYSSMSERINNNLIDGTLVKTLINELNLICRKNVKIYKGMQLIIDEQNNTVNENLDFINKKLSEYDFKYLIKKNTISQKNLKAKANPMLELVLVPCNHVNLEKKFSKDDIKGILSEGEKSILSWVFFLLNLKEKLVSGNHLIIIDDPISSYDSYRRFNLITELNTIIDMPASKEIMLLSHEKSFSNVLLNNKKFKSFVMQDGELKDIDLSELVESDYKHDLLYLKNNRVINTKKALIKFLITSRNVMEYYYSLITFANVKYFRKKEYDYYYSIASSIIHLQSNNLPFEYIKYISKLMKMIIKEKIIFKFENIDLSDLNLQTELNHIDDVYLARIKINFDIINILNNNGCPFKIESTTGELLKEVKKLNLLDNDKYIRYKSYLPLLNVYNHVNDNYGLRRVDCNEIKMKAMFDYLNTF